MKQIPISAIQGFRIGHAQDAEHATGCTAILCERPRTARRPPGRRRCPECMGRAINHAALLAEPAYGLKAAKDFR